ncbi:ABC transporter permease [Rhodococcus aerolatus]
MRVVPLPDAGTARTQVSDGAVEAALVPAAGGGATAVTRTALDDTLAPVLETAVRQAALADALQARGVDPGAVAADVSVAGLTVDALDPPDADTGQRTALAYVAVLLLFFTVFVYGIYVATGVVEEKQSRVVELLLSTITPLQLLVGKVVGIGAVGLTQVVLLGGAGLVTATATGVLTIGATAAGLLAVTVVWYVLGFAFFALLYAAAGSLVSRQEDVNAVSGPLTVVGFAAYFAAQYAVNDPGGTVARVLTWVPPFSAYLVPLRTAQGLVSPGQQVLTVVLMLLACTLAALLAARVYRRSVLHTGGRQSWRTALARG